MPDVFAPQVRRVVRVLDEDEPLAAKIAAGQLSRARATARAHEVVIQAGAWASADEHLRPTAPGGFGLLILEGTLCGSRTVADRSTLELLGPGDLLEPWVELGDDFMVPYVSEWSVLTTMRVARLDRGFALRVARWPEISAALMHRLVLRARRLAVQLSIASIPSADDRILYMLWALADRWGVVTPRGVELRVRLTHEMLAHLVGVQRPTATVAIARLRTAGRLTCAARRVTLLGEPPAELVRLSKEAGLPPRRLGRRSAATSAS